MPFKKLSTVSLTDLFTEELKRMILTGELRAGEQLPPERQMASEMNVSLAVVHAGITRLTALGFLRVAPRKGIFVADYLRTGDLNTMMAIVDFSGRALDSDAFDLLTGFRRSFEVLVTKKACEHRTEEDLAALAEIVRRAGDKAEAANAPEIGFTFHHALALASGNPYYPMVMQSFRPVYVFFYKTACAHSYTQRQFAEQLASILDAVRRQDPQAAEEIILRIIDNWVREFEKTEKFRRS